MAWYDGLVEGFGDMGKELVHIFKGNHGEQAQKDLEQAQKNVEDNMAANGGNYSVSDSLLGIGFKDTLDWLVIGVFALLAYVFIFRD